MAAAPGTVEVVELTDDTDSLIAAATRRCAAALAGGKLAAGCSTTT